jgi:hypothetical protein
MPYRIAGIDVHKRMLAVVVSEVEIDGEYDFERRQFGSNPAQLRLLAAWLLEQQVEEVVMESTAQYWKPVWGALERYWKPICQKREGARPMSGTLHLGIRPADPCRVGCQRAWRAEPGCVQPEWLTRGEQAGEQLATGRGAVRPGGCAGAS